jgi:hypothetical protein
MKHETMLRNWTLQDKSGQNKEMMWGVGVGYKSKSGKQV